MNFDKVPEPPDLPPDSPRSRRRRVVLMVLILVAAGLLYRWLPVGTNATAASGDGQKQVAAEIAFLEGRLEILTANLAGLGPDAPFDLRHGLIEEVVARLERLRRLRPIPRPQDEVRLAEWQVRLGNSQAREWNRRSHELEAAGDALRERDQPAAIGKLKEALQLQREVNRGLADQALKNHAREARLEQEVGQLETEPLAAEGRRLLGQARENVAAGRWTAALELYSRARDIRLRLNREHARTRFADLLAVDRIEAEMAVLSAGEAHDQLEKLVAQATAAATAQKSGEAVELLTAAVARQRLINGQFPQSRFASMERLEQLETDRQTLSAGVVLGEVRALDLAAAGHLRRREIFQAQQLAGQAQNKLEDAVARLPKARGVDEELRARLAYLNLKQADLTGIQDQSYDLLLPLSGPGSYALLRTGVPQGLFARIMSTNPSHNAGDALPVDSVTWTEAVEFCRRLGWVLGAHVRLPTEAEFRAGAGETASKDTSGRLAEWLAASAGGPMASVAGADGSVRDAPRVERSRATSFRVVVEVDLLAGR